MTFRPRRCSFLRPSVQVQPIETARGTLSLRYSILFQVHRSVHGKKDLLYSTLLYSTLIFSGWKSKDGRDSTTAFFSLFVKILEGLGSRGITLLYFTLLYSTLILLYSHPTLYTLYSRAMSRLRVPEPALHLALGTSIDRSIHPSYSTCYYTLHLVFISFHFHFQLDTTPG